MASPLSRNLLAPNIPQLAAAAHADRAQVHIARPHRPALLGNLQLAFAVTGGRPQIQLSGAPADIRMRAGHVQAILALAQIHPVAGVIVFIVEVALHPRRRDADQQVVSQARIHPKMNAGQIAIPVQGAAPARQLAVFAATPEDRRGAASRAIAGLQRQHKVGAGQHLLEVAAVFGHGLAVGAERAGQSALPADGERARRAPGLPNPPLDGADGAAGHGARDLRQDHVIERGVPPPVRGVIGAGWPRRWSPWRRPRPGRSHSSQSG